MRLWLVFAEEGRLSLSKNYSAQEGVLTGKEPKGSLCVVEKTEKLQVKLD